MTWLTNVKCGLTDCQSNNDSGECCYAEAGSLNLISVINNTGEGLLRCSGYKLAHKENRKARTFNIPEVMSTSEIPLFFNNLDEK